MKLSIDSRVVTSVSRPFSAPIRATIRAVVEAGNVARQADRAAKTKSGDGHRSIITQGDQKAEAVLVSTLLVACPEALILSEEDADNPNMLSKDCPDGLMEARTAFVIDPVDGTAPYGSYLGNWCVSAGAMSRGNLFGGVVYAPDLNGGMLLVSEEGVDTVVADNCLFDDWRVTSIEQFSRPTAPGNSIIFRGSDSDLFAPIGELFNREIAPSVRVTGIANSGVLGLTQVACGRLTAIIQCPQKSWDWAGAYRAVLETGRIISFFRLVPDPEENGSDMLMEVGENVYDFDAFRYEHKHRLGFIAGEPDMVRRLMELIPRKGYARVKPETTLSVW